MKTGPCCKCGRSIDWETPYCIHCEREMEEEERIEEEKQLAIEDFIKQLNKEGWVRDLSSDCLVFCPNCTKKAGENAKLITQENTQDEIERQKDGPFFGFSCYSCNKSEEIPLPSLPSTEDDY